MLNKDRSLDTGQQANASGAVRGGAAIALASGGRYALRLTVLVVLARLLTPEEFGIVAMITALLAFGAVFQELGLSAATVQRDKLSFEAASTLFWINASVGLILSAGFMLAAPLIADFYRHSELELLCRIGAFTFLLNGLAVQMRAQLQRSMRFVDQARTEFLAAVVGGVVALVMACRGLGYWSLIWQILLTDFAALVLFYRATRFLPTGPSLTSEVRELVRFGASLFGFNILRAGAQNLYIALIGRDFGASAAGIYTRGFVLAGIAQGFIYTAAGQVALPKLSRVKGSSVEFSEFYYQGVRLLTFVTVPIAMAFAVFGDQVTYIVYGSQWDDVGDILRILAVGMLVAPILHSTGQVFVSRGETHRMLRWGVFGWSVLGASTVIGLEWGIRGVAWGWSLGNLVLLLPCVSYAFRGTHLTIRGLAAALAGIFCASACMAIVGFATRKAMAGQVLWVQFPVSLMVSAIFYLLVSYYLFGGKSLMRSVLMRILVR